MVTAPGEQSEGYLVLKSVNKRLAEQSPLGRVSAEQHVRRMERALQLYKGYLPEGHPTLLRLQYSMATELRKLGRESDAKWAEQEALQFARKFSDSDTEPIYQQDAEFLLGISGSLAAAKEKRERRNQENEQKKLVRPLKHWAD